MFSTASTSPLSTSYSESEAAQAPCQWRLSSQFASPMQVPFSQHGTSYHPMPPATLEAPINVYPNSAFGLLRRSQPFVPIAVRLNPPKNVMSRPLVSSFVNAFHSFPRLQETIPNAKKASSRLSAFSKINNFGPLPEKDSSATSIISNKRRRSSISSTRCPEAMRLAKMRRMELNKINSRDQRQKAKQQQMQLEKLSDDMERQNKELKEAKDISRLLPDLDTEHLSKVTNKIGDLDGVREVISSCADFSRRRIATLRFRLAQMEFLLSPTPQDKILLLAINCSNDSDLPEPIQNSVWDLLRNRLHSTPKHSQIQKMQELARRGHEGLSQLRTSRRLVAELKSRVQALGNKLKDETENLLERLSPENCSRCLEKLRKARRF